MANPAKEKKNKEGREENALLRRLLEEVTVLRSEVEAIKEGKPSPEPPLRKQETEIELSTEQISGLLAGVEDVDVSRLAYAFASPQKVKIVRILLQEGPLSSAKIGESTGLTTGSLYHHLRELTHAEVIELIGRSQYGLTSLGRCTALALFRLAR